MIKLTRLNGSQLYINPDLIEAIEETPDTHLTLSNGNKYLVLEPATVIIEKIIGVRAKVMRRAVSMKTAKYLVKSNAQNYRPVCKLDGSHRD